MRRRAASSSTARTGCRSPGSQLPSSRGWLSSVPRQQMRTPTVHRALVHVHDCACFVHRSIADGKNTRPLLNILTHTATTPTTACTTRGSASAHGLSSAVPARRGPTALLARPQAACAAACACRSCASSSCWRPRQQPFSCWCLGATGSGERPAHANAHRHRACHRDAHGTARGMQPPHTAARTSANSSCPVVSNDGGSWFSRRNASQDESGMHRRRRRYARMRW